MQSKPSTKQVVFHGALAEYAATLTDADYAFLDYTNEITDAIYLIMEKAGVTKAELARRLDKKKSFITKALSGEQNMTFKTFTSILTALDAKPVTKIIAKDESLVWVGRSYRKTKKQSSCCVTYNNSSNTTHKSTNKASFKNWLPEAA